MTPERRYREQVDRVRAQVRAAVPEGGRVLVMTRGDEALLRLGRREGGHFPQSPTGLYAGHYPADGAAAVAHLEELRAEGARYLAIPAEASWWLDHYPELRELLEREGELLAGDPEVALVYALAPKEGAVRRPGSRRRRSATRAPLRLPRRSGRKRVLQICHSHPRARPGGAEVYAHELHRHLRDSGEWESIFLARSGPPHSSEPAPADGSRVTRVEGEPDEFLLHTEGLDFDWMLGTMRRPEGLYSEDLRRFLLAAQPDVVHFQHTLFIGYDAIREVRRTLPGVPIIYTLHEFLSICHNKGQMVRTFDRSLCGEASPRRCAECFPGVDPERFLHRERFIRAALGLVDLFVAPSETLRERYVEWGIPRERILLEDYGRAPAPRTAEAARSVSAESARPAPHDTLGIFGQVNPYKGVDVLLRAMQSLGPEAPPLRLHGANLDLQEHRFRDEIAALLAAAPSVTDCGPYPPGQAAEMIAAVDWVVVPSIWWENSPLVIQEAFAAGRPVICSDIGGMAEKVEDNVNGLHFRVGDPESLAATIRRAVDTPGLWDHLRKGIPTPHAMPDHAAVLTQAYETLLQPELHQILRLPGGKFDAVRSEGPGVVA